MRTIGKEGGLGGRDVGHHGGSDGDGDDDGDGDGDGDGDDDIIWSIGTPPASCYNTVITGSEDTGWNVGTMRVEALEPGVSGR